LGKKKNEEMELLSKRGGADLSTRGETGKILRRTTCGKRGTDYVCFVKATHRAPKGFWKEKKKKGL